MIDGERCTFTELDGAWELCPPAEQYRAWLAMWQRCKDRGSVVFEVTTADTGPSVYRRYQQGDSPRQYMADWAL